LRAAGDFLRGILGAKAIFFDFWRKKGAFTDPASSATFFCVAKLKVLLPRSMRCCCCMLMPSIEEKMLFQLNQQNIAAAAPDEAASR
jgi:hypothetical protein